LGLLTVSPSPGGRPWQRRPQSDKEVWVHQLNVKLSYDRRIS